MDTKQIIVDRELNQQKVIQLLKKHLEGRMWQQIEFYLDTAAFVAFAGLIEHLNINFGSAGDKASLKQEFYSRTQTVKETADNFADSLQTITRKIISVDPSFKKEVEGALKVQFANVLHDTNHQVQARGMLNTDPRISFVKFKTELTKILWTRWKRVHSPK